MRLPSPSTLLCPLCSEGFVEEINGLSLHPSAALLLSGELGPHSGSRRDEPLHHRRSPFSQAREILSLWRSQARQPGFPDAEEEGHHGARLDALDRMFSRREGRSEAVAAAGNDGFELWLGLGSRHGDPSPRFMDRLQSFFGRRRGRSNIGNDRLGLGLGSRHSSGSRRLIDVREFLLGPGGDLLIQHLIEGGDTGRHGSAPASKAAVEAMPTLTISKQSLEADDIYCAVCKEVFDIGGEAREMPCKHIYHSNCILPWLALHNSCPMCRHEMPSEALVDNQARRTEASLETIRSEGNESTNANGERGLAIVGIPGIGILVRSFLLFGNGTQNEANTENQASSMDPLTQVLNSNATQSSDSDATQSLNVDAPTQAPNPISQGNSRDSESMHNEESVLSTSCEVHPLVLGDETASALRHINSTNSNGGYHSNMQISVSHDASNIESDSGSQVTGRRRRNFLSWLSRPSSSSQAHSSDMVSEASSSNSRRRRFWFLDQ